MVASSAGPMAMSPPWDWMLIQLEGAPPFTVVVLEQNFGPGGRHPGHQPCRTTADAVNPSNTLDSTLRQAGQRSLISLIPRSSVLAVVARQESGARNVTAG